MIPLRSEGTADTDGENAGEGAVSRLLGSVRVIAGRASAILTTLASHPKYHNRILSLMRLLRLLPGDFEV
jgi:hypothetical protein